MIVLYLYFKIEIIVSCITRKKNNVQLNYCYLRNHFFCSFKRRPCLNSIIALVSLGFGFLLHQQKFDTILMLLIGSPVKFGIAAPSYHCLPFKLPLCNMVRAISGTMLHISLYTFS